LKSCKEWANYIDSVAALAARGSVSKDTTHFARELIMRLSSALFVSQSAAFGGLCILSRSFDLCKESTFGRGSRKVKVCVNMKSENNGMHIYGFVCETASQSNVSHVKNKIER